jgi:hypothetical protein
MPTSNHRHKHKHHPHPGRETPPKPKAKTKAAPFMAVIGAAVGLAIVYFSNNTSTIWMIAGSAIGALAGYLFGHGVDKAAEKK